MTYALCLLQVRVLISLFPWRSMPKIKTSRVKYPEGWELIEPTLRDLEAKMREGMHICIIFNTCWIFFQMYIAVSCYRMLVMWCFDAAENDTHDGKRKCEALWPIFRISHQKSRYIYDLYYRRKEIKKELYEFCLDQGYADKNLIAKWKKVGGLDHFRHALFWACIKYLLWWVLFSSLLSLGTSDCAIMFQFC